LLATGMFDGTIDIWDTSTLEVVMTIPSDAGIVTGLDWHPNQNKLAAISLDGWLYIWEYESRN